MKKSILTSLIFLSYIIDTYAQNNGQFKVRQDDYIQIGYETYKSLNFGKTVTNVPSHPNNGSFGIEYWTPTSGTAGLNVWKPWPTASGGNYLLFIGDNGNIGINSSGSTSYKLSVNGSVRANNYYSLSDERLKENIVSIANATDNLNKIKVYQYKYKQFEKLKEDEETINKLKPVPNLLFDNELHFGVKAQELKNIYPNLVKQDSDSGYYSVNYTELIPILIKGVQEQDARIKNLEEKVANLKK